MAQPSHISVDDDHRLELVGPALAATERRVLAAFAAQLSVALVQRRLATEAAHTAVLAEADRTRTALLAAVSHDLRNPLASAKAAVTSLRAPDVTLDNDDRDQLLDSAERSLDRLTRLVDNLLDMSRLQVGALSVHLQHVAVQDALAAALDELHLTAPTIITDVPDDLPAISADQPLLERVLVNLLSNALKHSPPHLPIRISASALAERVELRIVDRGPGIPASDHTRVFTPFQRQGDTDNTTGIGLGLALSRGLAEAMGGFITPEETPGGGLTMVLTLAAAPTSPSTPLMDHT